MVGCDKTINVLAELNHRLRLDLQWIALKGVPVKHLINLEGDDEESIWHDGGSGTAGGL